MTSDVVYREPDVGGRLQSCDLGISTVSIPAFTTRRRSSMPNVVGEQLASSSQSRAAKCDACARPLGLPRFPAAAPDGVLFLEPGVRGVEFGDRGVHVFEVEPDLQRDSTLLVDAVYLEKLVLRRPGAQRRQCPTPLEREPGARLARR